MCAVKFPTTKAAAKARCQTRPSAAGEGNCIFRRSIRAPAARLLQKTRVALPCQDSECSTLFLLGGGPGERVCLQKRPELDSQPADASRARKSPGRTAWTMISVLNEATPFMSSGGYRGGERPSDRWWARAGLSHTHTHIPEWIDILPSRIPTFLTAQCSISASWAAHGGCRAASSISSPLSVHPHKLTVPPTQIQPGNGRKSLQFSAAPPLSLTGSFCVDKLQKLKETWKQSVFEKILMTAVSPAVRESD